MKQLNNKRKPLKLETVQVARPKKDPTRVKSKNIKVSEDCHRRYVEYLKHQPPHWKRVDEIGDVAEIVLDEWEERRKD